MECTMWWDTLNYIKIYETTSLKGVGGKGTERKNCKCIESIKLNAKGTVYNTIVNKVYSPGHTG